MKKSDLSAEERRTLRWQKIASVLGMIVVLASCSAVRANAELDRCTNTYSGTYSC